jgi:hypothetical protein
LHLTLLVVVPACVALCLWQLDRARSGNTLSWAYVFEWPILGAYAVYMWWKLVHEPAPTAAPRGEVETVIEEGQSTADAGTIPTTAAGSEEEDEELAAYNRYLAELNLHGPPKRW